MLNRVSETIGRYAMFETGQKVGVAVSGGCDSVCLLDALAALAPRWGLRLSVLHVDHQLRGKESSGDALFVEQLAGRLSVPFHLERPVLAPGNLEEAAREARLAFFRRLLQSGALDRVALGHTRSDQAETVLFRLLRGAGSAGLASIRPISPEGIVRPLIRVTRAEVTAYLNERNIPWRDDSTNADIRFSRNRIRRELLPLLEEQWNPEFSLTLSQIADWAFEEERYWEREMAGLERQYLILQPPAVLARAETIANLPRAVARRLVRHALGLARGDVRSVGFRHVEEVLGLAEGAGSGRMQTPGVDVLRSFDWIRFLPLGSETAGDREFRAAVSPPCRIRLPGGGPVLTIDLQAVEAGYTGRMSGLDWDRCVSDPLELRTWRPGDQYQPAGSTRSEKLKTYFQQARIPLWERRYWPVLAGCGSILWARRFGYASDFAATPGSRIVLRIREIDNAES